jgi:hypothetical protein
MQIRDVISELQRFDQSSELEVVDNKRTQSHPTLAVLPSFLSGGRTSIEIGESEQVSDLKSEIEALELDSFNEAIKMGRIEEYVTSLRLISVQSGIASDAYAKKFDELEEFLK